MPIQSCSFHHRFFTCGLLVVLGSNHQKRFIPGIMSQRHTCFGVSTRSDWQNWSCELQSHDGKWPLMRKSKTFLPCEPDEQLHWNERAAILDSEGVFLPSWRFKPSQSVKCRNTIEQSGAIQTIKLTNQWKSEASQWNYVSSVWPSI